LKGSTLPKERLSKLIRQDNEHEELKAKKDLEELALTEKSPDDTTDFKFPDLKFNRNLEIEEVQN